MARHFLESFLPQFVLGGSVSIGEPLGPAGLEAVLQRTRYGEGTWHARLGTGGDVEQARIAFASEVAVPRGSMPLTERDARLGVAIYNLLAISHPSNARLDARPFGRAQAVRFTYDLTRSIAAPLDVLEALSAHTLVGRLFETSRKDTYVDFWAGQLVYRGHRPPERVQRWKKLRRVEVREQRVPATSTFVVQDQWVVLDRVLLASPLTDLLTADRAAPTFTFAGSARWLADPDLCRGIIYHWATAADPLHLGGVLTRAMLVRAQWAGSATEILLLVHTLYHLYMMLNAEAEARGDPMPVSGGPGTVPATLETRTFVALIKVLEAERRWLGIPPRAELGDALEQRMGRHRAALAETDTRDEEQRILRELRRALPLEASERNRVRGE